MKKLIYLASPYSSEERSIIALRVAQVQKATAKLIEQGNLIFSPIVHSHPIADLVSFSPINTQGADGMSAWMDYDRAMIDKADEVWVLCLPGWTDSRGVKAEMSHAYATSKTVRLINWPSLTERGAVVGAGSFYSPQSTGKAPIFLDKETHTSYAVGDIEKIIKQTIVGLNGVAQSGKDTAGQRLVEKHGFVRVGLADAVREALYELNPYVKWERKEPILDERGWNLAQSKTDCGYWYYGLQRIVDVKGWEFAKQIPEVRALLQRIGTEAGRNIHGDSCWIEIARKKIEAAYPAPVVITDIRFENEAELVRSLGGSIWRITRPGVEAINGHASEQGFELREGDIVLSNEGTKDDLYADVDELARDLK